MTAAPCNWGVTVSGCPAFDNMTDAEQANVVSMATDFLWNWTGRNFGVCTIVTRPCRVPYYQPSTFWGGGPFPMMATPWQPVMVNGQWFNFACGRCGTECSCTHTPALKLPGPVQTITQVLIDGAVLPSTAYRVDDERYLVRLDGNEWPACQNMAANPATDVDTFEVTYTAGIPVPQGGQIAASILACEFAKAIATPGDCALPKRIQNVTRQGVTVTLFNNFDDLEKGGTGIWLIDSWVASVMKSPRSATVRSPDLPHPRSRRTTWVGP